MLITEPELVGLCLAGVRLGRKAVVNCFGDDSKPASTRGPYAKSVAESIAPPKAQRQSSAQESARKVKFLQIRLRRRFRRELNRQ